MNESCGCISPQLCHLPSFLPLTCMFIHVPAFHDKVNVCIMSQCIVGQFFKMLPKYTNASPFTYISVKVLVIHAHVHNVTFDL